MHDVSVRNKISEVSVIHGDLITAIDPPLRIHALYEINVPVDRQAREQRLIIEAALQEALGLDVP